jgi:hypothetical protein
MFSRSVKRLLGAIALVLWLVAFALAPGISKEEKTGKHRNAVIFVADGLRATSVNEIDAPTMSWIRRHGTNFVNSHSLFPTFTTPNASAIATGHLLGDTGDFGNVLFFTGDPEFWDVDRYLLSKNFLRAGGSVTPFIEQDRVLSYLDKLSPSNNFLNETSLLAAARASNFQTAVVGKLGPALIQDVTEGNLSFAARVVPVRDTIVIDDKTGSDEGIPLSSEMIGGLLSTGLPVKAPPRGRNGVSGTSTIPGTLCPNNGQQQYFADVTTKVILPQFKNAGKNFVLVYWSRDPDGTQHNQGDSLGRLAPGINGATSRLAVRDADDNLKQILQSIKDLGLEADTDIFVTADHGFSTISKSILDQGGRRTTSYASSQNFPGVNRGWLPSGFLAIDLAHELKLPLYDPDHLLSEGYRSFIYAPIDPAKGQLPRAGNALIGGSGTITVLKPDAQVVVAANGGSDLLYLPKADKPLARRVVDFLCRQDYTSGVFVDEDALGTIPGALSMNAIGLCGSATMPRPSIVVNFRSFALESAQPTASAIEIADSSLQQGQGMHGSFSRADTFNNMAAIGPDFKEAYEDRTPVSNADVPVTMAEILRIPLPSMGKLRGRVISEALRGHPDATTFTSGVVQSAPASSGVCTILNYQELQGFRYFDAAGFAGRTVGLRSNQRDRSQR